LGPEVLGRATASIQGQAADDRILVGFDTSDDAGVVRLEDGSCLVQTVDFLTPIVDDPYTFGAIAAANALSDVYAMGGTPVSALNILCWPQDDLDETILAQMLAGGLAKIREAGAVLLGGHSVRDAELKYGLAVTGTIAEQDIWTHGGAQPGDVLVLTKALGTGIVSTALKADSCDQATWEAARDSMLELNAASAGALRRFDVHAVTDVTGFGLLGHAWEMARASGVCLELDASRLPTLGAARDLAAAGFVTGAAASNLRYVEGALEAEDVGSVDLAIALDPQTSGGLLVALPQEDGSRFAREAQAHVVGRAHAGPARLVLTPRGGDA
jgi:selenide,water dikinase